MCILQVPITNTKTLIEALEKAEAEIQKIRVFEDIIDGSQVTAYIKPFTGDDGLIWCDSNRRYSVIVLTKIQPEKYAWEKDDGQQ